MVMVNNYFNPNIDGSFASRVSELKAFINQLLNNQANARDDLSLSMQQVFGFPDEMNQRIIQRVFENYLKTPIGDICQKLEKNPYWNAKTRIGIILPGNVPDPLFESVLLAWLNGSELSLKLSRKTQKFDKAFLRILQTLNKNQFNRIRTTALPEDFIKRSHTFDSCIAYGSDETMQQISSTLGGKLSLDCRGHRLSIVILSPIDIKDGVEVANLIARDTWLYDQRGCLSPQIVFMPANMDFIAELIKKAMDAINREHPMSKRPYELQIERNIVIQRLQAQSMNQREVRVIGDKSDLAQPWAYQLEQGRMVHAHSGQIIALRQYETMDDIRKTVSLMRDYIHCIGLNGLGLDKPMDYYAQALRLKSLRRLCPIGQMQSPPIGWDL
ncbi:MAG: hypothetical protein ACI9CF_001260 [Candidatus Omnitrophota bacterium]|jgi:hypothetical protein